MSVPAPFNVSSERWRRTALSEAPSRKAAQLAHWPGTTDVSIGVWCGKRPPRAKGQRQIRSQLRISVRPAAHPRGH